MLLPMLLRNVNSVDINSIFEKPLMIGNFEIVAAHLPLAHTSVLSKGPVLKTVTSPPLTIGVMEFVPELNSNL